MDAHKTTDTSTVKASEKASLDVSWRQSLQFKMTIGFVAVSLAMIVAVISIFQILVKPILIEKNRIITEETGARLVTELGKHLEKTETLTRAIADLGQALPKEESSYHNIVPQLLGKNDINSNVAGGGVWPEPFRFNPTIERRSFFWGRNPDGTLDFYDDYNDPEGKGYHHEEWYVPTRNASKNQCFWSKSYVDPYSFEPMVTCTVPMRKNDKYAGAVTIDLRLASLREFLGEVSEEINGYVFAVDRNNKFLSFPDLTRAKIKIQSPNGDILEDFITARDLGETEPEFKPISDALEGLNQTLITNFRTSPTYSPMRAIEIARNSYQIEKPEAELIMAMLSDSRWDAPITPSLPQRLELKSDILITEPVFVSTFLIPKTYWKVVIVTPQSLAALNASEFIQQAIIWLLVILLISASSCLFLLRLTIVRPLINMSKSLRTMTEGNSENIPLLDVGSKDELGNLARSFNQRREEIHDINNALKQEISERKRAQDNLVQAKEKAEIANRSKTQFLANMSHELRTPLNTIIGFSELIVNGKNVSLSLDTSIEYATDIKNSGQHLLEIINDILDVARVEVGEIEIREEPIDIEELFTKCLRMMNGQAESSQLILQSKIPADFSYLLADHRQLKQILINLLANAIKFTPEGGTVSMLAYYTASEGITLSVIDTGVGIAKEDLLLVQEPFTQLDNAFTKKHHGTGLGLTISKALTECHNGELIITSTVDVGTTIDVHFPPERTVPRK